MKKPNVFKRFWNWASVQIERRRRFNIDETIEILNKTKQTGYKKVNLKELKFKQ